MATICMLPEKVCRTVCRGGGHEPLVDLRVGERPFHLHAGSPAEAGSWDPDHVLFVYARSPLFCAGADRFHLRDHFESAISPESGGNEACGRSELIYVKRRVCSRRREEATLASSRESR